MRLIKLLLDKPRRQGGTFTLVGQQTPLGPTGTQGFVLGVETPKDIPDIEVALRANETAISAPRDSLTTVVNFARLGRGKIIILSNSPSIVGVPAK